MNQRLGVVAANGALLALLGGAALSPVPAGAQQYFGQNQVQYDRFRWRVLETEHFLIHYYPEEKVAIQDAARMAERAYGRLSRVLQHQFREKKPIVLFASRSDFGQNNVLGDLGEGVGGVTEPIRHRIIMPFTGDYRSFDHVLTHELVHEFQYDIFARGKAGGGLQTLTQVDPPLWFAEGMAEYLSIGPDHPFTMAWIRDAALNGALPSIEQMTLRPDMFFPYRYGMSLWQYIGQRWGDEIIGDIMNDVPNVGLERAFRRKLGLTLEDLSDEWKEAMQNQHLPQIANLERARKFAQPLLTERKSGGQIFTAPALSPDGKQIAFLSNGNFFRGEVFIDLWLGDAETGKRMKRLVKSTTDPDFEELQLVASQSAFSPDGKLLAFTALRNGKDVLYLLDVRRRKTIKRFDLDLEGVIGPSWSPDGRQLVLSGNTGGITDLYVVDRDGKNLRRLTNDKHGDLQPQWSPDGRYIAFASDRGPDADFSLLAIPKWRISVYDLESGRVDVLPGQGGLNINPMWAPDGKSIAFVSDRTGIQNVFLYDLQSKEHYQLTNVAGSVSSFTEYSPAITWARGADKLAFTYYDNGNYTIWSVSNPRLLKRTPFRDGKQPVRGPLIAGRPGIPDTTARTRPGETGDGVLLGAATLATARLDSAPVSLSLYRGPSGVRASAALPLGVSRTDTTVISVAALLDSAAHSLPDTTRFKEYGYKVAFQPEYVARPQIGYGQNSYARGVVGGTTIVLSDLLGNNRLAIAGQVNGRISDAELFTGYTNLSRRFQYSAGLYQLPFYIPTGSGLQVVDEANGIFVEDLAYTRYMFRQIYAVGMYPLNRFKRFELGARFSNLDQTTRFFSRVLDYSRGLASPFLPDSTVNEPGINYVSPYAAYVWDNTLFGYTGPIMGQRWRFQIEPTVGTFNWVDYLVDYRRYDPIIFSFLTVATRVMSDFTVGRDEDQLPKYLGYPDFIRGYDRERFTYACNAPGTTGETCGARELVGSRVALVNTEIRFPLIRRFDLGLIPISLPPLEGLIFHDIGVAWYRGQSVYWSRPDNYDADFQRYPLRSYGLGLRLNLFNYAILRWDYARPVNKPAVEGKKPWMWTFSLGPSF